MFAVAQTDKFRSRRRRAVTLLELIVVIAIVVLLMAMILPALEGARDQSRRTRCMSNLRQVSLATSMHADALGVIPHNGYWNGKQTISTIEQGVFTPSTTDFSSERTYYWGVGDSSLSPLAQQGSWIYCLLPYSEQESVFRQRAWTVPIPMVVCAARRSPTCHIATLEDPHGKYSGGGWRWSKTDYAANVCIVEGRPHFRPTKCWRLAEIQDGLSHTILAGEKAFDPTVQTTTSWHWDEPLFLGGSSGTIRKGFGIVRDRRLASYKSNWGSPHIGGAMFAFCDSSVRLLSFDTDWKLMAALLKPDRGEAQ
jgi:type II secretory pathway pseudopilin PulG